MSNYNVVVYKFKMGDVEDPDLYSAAPMLQWEKTEEGKWVMANAVPESVKWQRYPDPVNFGYEYSIRATFSKENYIFWKLKYE